MARLPRKLTTAALGYHHIAWLRDLAVQEGNAGLARTCDVAREGTALGIDTKGVRAAQKIVADEVNRRAGHSSARARKGASPGLPAPGVPGDGSAPTREKSNQQLEAEIRELLGGGGARGAAIVVAWTEDTQEIAPGQRSWRHDLGERPKFVDVKKAHAAMWARHGSEDDLAKARAYLKKEHPNSGQVFVYPTSERDPLGRARRDVLVG